MDESAERRLEERLDRGLGELRDALIRIEAKLDTKAGSNTVEKQEERIRALELSSTKLETRMAVYLGAFSLIGVPVVSFVLRKIGL